jgi:hypothetical protein
MVNDNDINDSNDNDINDFIFIYRFVGPVNRQRGRKRYSRLLLLTPHARFSNNPRPTVDWGAICSGKFSFGKFLRGRVRFASGKGWPGVDPADCAVKCNLKLKTSLPGSFLPAGPSTVCQREGVAGGRSGRLCCKLRLQAQNT